MSPVGPPEPPRKPYRSRGFQQREPISLEEKQGCARLAIPCAVKVAIIVIVTLIATCFE